MAPPILKSKKRARHEQGDEDRHVRFGEATVTSPSGVMNSNDNKGNGQSILRSSKHRQGVHEGDRNGNQDDNDEDDVSQFGVEISYDEGGAISKAAIEKARKRRRRGDDVDIDDDDGEDIPMERTTKAPAGKRSSGMPRQGEEAVDSTYSLFTDQSATAADCPIEAFNMEEERTSGEGYFDGDTYVFREKGGAAGKEQDAWLDSLDTTTEEGVAATAARSKVRLNTKVGENGSDDDDESIGRIEEEPSIQDKISLIHELISLLATPAETVSAAMRRYGRLMGRNAARSKLPKSESHQKQTGYIKSNKPSPSNQTAQVASDKLQRLTALTNALLLQHNEHDIYQKTRQDLEFVVGVLDASNTETIIGINTNTSVSTSLNDAGEGSGTNTTSYFSEPKKDTLVIGPSARPISLSPTSEASKQLQMVQWEYIGQADQQMHGPYTTEHMIQWTSAGYFVGASAVKIRPIGGSSSNKSNSDAIDTNAGATTTVNDLMADLEDSDDNDFDNNGEETTTENSMTASKELPSPWMQSDQVDFKAYC